MELLFEEVWLNILSHLDARTLCSVSQTSFFFFQLANDRLLWSGLLSRERKAVMMVPSWVSYESLKDLYVHRKDYLTIEEAVKAAETSCERQAIYLSPGLYKECIVIDKPMSIIGEGPIGGTVVEGTKGNTVSSRADEACVSNLVLKQQGHSFCVDIEKGALQLTHCHITNSTLSAIKVGKDASPLIAHNLIFDTNEAGVAIFGGSGAVRDNEFRGNRYGSIEVVYDTASPLIANNNIHHNKGYGIHIHSKAKAIVEGNSVHDNDSDGISVWGGADPLVRDNKVFGNKGDGIFVHEKATGTFSGNEVHHQRLDGMRVSKSEPVVKHNMLYANDGDGIRIVCDANPAIKFNKIYENNRVGVHVYREGRGVVSGNEILANRNAGMQIYGAGRTHISNNRILGNRCAGVYASDRAQVTVSGNEIAWNSDSGVEIVSGALATMFQNNLIHHNLRTGVAFYPDSKPRMLEQANWVHSNGPSRAVRISTHRNSFDESSFSFDYVTGVCPTFADASASAASRAARACPTARLGCDVDMLDPMDEPSQAECDSEELVCFNPADEASLMDYASHRASRSEKKFVPERSSSARNSLGRDLTEREGRELYLAPIKKGNDSEAVSFLAEKAIQARECTFGLTREYYHAQYWYECITCSQTRQILGKAELSVCESCARQCHKNHELSARKFGHFYCDCGQNVRGAVACKCIDD